jgi:hypothetical protein
MARRRSRLAESRELFTPGINTAHQLELRAMQEFAPANYTAQSLIEAIYDADLLRKLRDGYEVGEHPYGRRAILMELEGTRFQLNVDFEELQMLPPNADYTTPKGVVPHHVMDHWLAMFAIHQKWSDVRHVCTWLNLHSATLGAARYYWPSILMLMPQNEDLAACSGTRYKDVPGISEIIPLMRETATTIATMKLLPEERKDSALTTIVKMGFVDEELKWFHVA